jgi:hypothetical protein
MHRPFRPGLRVDATFFGGSSACYLQVYANFGPPPASESAMAIMALVFYLILAAIAALVERLRLAP